MERRSPLTLLSLLRRKRRHKITLLNKKVTANKSSSWSEGWKQNSGCEKVHQLETASPEEKMFMAKGLQGKPEKRRRAGTTVDPLAVTRKDKGRKEELEKKASSKKNSRHALKGTTKIMGVCGEKDRRCRRKAWQLSQSSNTRSQNLEQDHEGFVDLVKEHGWDIDKELMMSLWAAS